MPTDDFSSVIPPETVHWPEDEPLIFLGASIAHRKRRQHELLVAWAQQVREAVSAMKTPDGQEWRLALAAPILATSPWIVEGPIEATKAEKKRKSREEASSNRRAIASRNYDIITNRADAFIIIDPWGSTGAGDLINVATGLGLPMLYLHPKDPKRHCPGSNHILGKTSELVEYEFDGRQPDALQGGVVQFLRMYRLQIEDGPRRRANRKVLLSELRAAAAAHWAALTPGQRLVRSSSARLTVERVDQLLADEGALSAGLVREMLDLAGVLRLDLATRLGPTGLPNLNETQTNALRIMVSDNSLDGSETLRLQEAGRLHLLKTARFRMRLDTPAAWLALYERIRNE
jgi:hypothetical protein